MRLIINEADLDGFEAQTIDAVEFLKRNETELEALGRYAGVEEIRLDFSVRNQKVVTQHYRFPPKILSLAASLGASLEISQYAVERPAKIDYLKGDSE
jgi:quinolinate synthase